MWVRRMAHERERERERERTDGGGGGGISERERREGILKERKHHKRATYEQCEKKKKEGQTAR